MIAVGIMSGTSADGADAIAIELESAATPHAPRVVAHAHEPYDADLRRLLLAPGGADGRRGSASSISSSRRSTRGQRRGSAR